MKLIDSTPTQNPGLLWFIWESGLPFHANEQFGKSDLDERYELYRSLAGVVWNPACLLGELK